MDRDYKFFDSIAVTYDEVRPGYPKELYRIASKYKQYSACSKILEIGGGQGIATQEICAFWNPDLTVLEPNLNFHN